MAEIANAGGGGNGKGAGKARKKSSTRVDMTPMVDLGFLLITFFMLTTTLSKQQIMQLNMPDKNDKDKKEEKTDIKESQAMTLLLGQDDKVFWYTTKDGVPDFHETDFNPNDGIRQVLLNKNKTVKDLVVVIKALDSAKYNNVVDIIDEMHITHTERYALVDITKQDEELIQKQLASDATETSSSIK